VAAQYVLSRRHDAPRWQRQKSKAGIVDIEVRGNDEERRIAIRRSPPVIGREVNDRERLAVLDPTAARYLSPGDRQRLVRAYEVARATGTPLSTWQRRPHPLSPYRFFTILLMPPRHRLYATCDARFVRMIEANALSEAAALARRGLDPDLPAMKAVGLSELLRYLHGEMPLEAAIAAAQRATRQYAKRQTTWFRHQTAPDLTLVEQFSQGLLRSSLRFVRESVLTG